MGKVVQLANATDVVAPSRTDKNERLSIGAFLAQHSARNSYSCRGCQSWREECLHGRQQSSSLVRW